MHCAWKVGRSVACRLADRRLTCAEIANLRRAVQIKAAKLLGTLMRLPAKAS